eukprot:COSAG06_NODE_3132_length_5805_cov_85.931300_9_plen_87_part_00
MLVYQPEDSNRDWSPRFSTLRDKNGWIRAKTAGNLNFGVSRNRFCDFLADPDSRSSAVFTLLMLNGAGAMIEPSQRSNERSERGDH